VSFFHTYAGVMIWLLGKATAEPWLAMPLVPLGLLSVVRARREPRALWLLLLPVFWLTPLALTAAAWNWTDPREKADAWVAGYPLLAACVGQTLASFYLVAILARTRLLAAATAVCNGLLMLTTIAVVMLSANGGWSP
jgi:hypothetical protein